LENPVVYNVATPRIFDADGLLSRPFQLWPVRMPPWSSAWRGPFVGVIQALLIGASLYLFLRGRRRDFHVPRCFWGDGLYYLMQSKSTVDNGWWWFNPMVGAPLGLDQLAFPANSNVDQLIVWAVSRMTPVQMYLRTFRARRSPAPASQCWPSTPSTR
jgi:hypothetical protein